jgi:hypothetical protein
MKHDIFCNKLCPSLVGPYTIVYSPLFNIFHFQFLINVFSRTAANVNKFIDPALEYIDDTNYFYKQSHIIKSMYNEDHSSGVHIGVESQIII